MLHFEEIKEKVKELSKDDEREPVVAFAQAADEVALEAAKLLNDNDLGTAILVGDEQKIRELAPGIGLDLEKNVIIDEPDDHKAAAKAVEACVVGDADVLCKGHMHTNAFLRAILNKEHGMRTGKTLCSLTAVDSKQQDRMFIATDCAMIVEPTLEDKKAIIEHATELANALETEMPKVALLSAVEEVNKNMPDGYDAAVLCKMNDRGQIKDCIVDGPLSLDLAISPYSAENKGIDSPVAGQADVIVMPNLQAGNIFWKSMTYLADTDTGAVVMGASKPVVLTSRADSAKNKLNSIAMALLLEKHQRAQKGEAKEEKKVEKKETKAEEKKTSDEEDKELVNKVIEMILKEVNDRGVDITK